MSEFHITRKMRWARERGQLPDEIYYRLLEEHHLSTCATCRREQEAYEQRHDYGAAFAAVQVAQEEQGERVAAEFLEAEGDLARLLELPSEERLPTIQRSRHRFRSPLLGRRLVDCSFGCLPHDPAGALDLASLASAVVQESAQHGAGEVAVLALAHIGNAHRALGCLPEARKSFERCRLLIRRGLGAGAAHEDITDLETYALVAWMESSYLRDIREFDAAENLLTLAALLFAIEEKSATLHRVVLSLGELYLNAGQIRDALDAVTRVLDNLDESEDPGLYWIARFNHASYLVEAGLFKTAQAELVGCRLAPGRPSEGQLRQRMRWLEGRIASGLGEYEHAEHLFRAVGEAYAGEGNRFNTALVSLDLAVVFLQQRRSTELRELAGRLAGLFEANEVHREALAAFLLFQEAVHQEQVTAAYVVRLRRYLEEARHNPRLAFEQPS